MQEKKVLQYCEPSGGTLFHLSLIGNLKLGEERREGDLIGVDQRLEELVPPGLVHWYEWMEPIYVDDDEVNEAVDEVPEVAEEDRKYLCDADGKNQLTGLGRSSAGRKKRKGSRGTILRTYDEMIESKPVYSSDEYDLELFINDE